MLLNDDESLFLESILHFAKKEVAPKVKAMDQAAQFDKTLIQALFKQGLMGIEIPAQYGGVGGSFFQSILAIQALGAYDPSVSVLVDTQNTLINRIIMTYANETLQQHYLPRLATSCVGSFCLTETHSGSDAFALKTQAVVKSDYDEISGRKIFITNAHEADFFIVFANADFSKKHKGITAYAIDRNTQGLSIGKKEHKLGIKASSTCEVILEQVKVPHAQRIGALGQGYKIAIDTLNEGRIGIAAQTLGLAEGALNAALSYAKTRMQFGQAITEFQGVQFQIADMATRIEAAKLLVYHAARCKEAKQPFSKQAAMAKLFASEVAESTASLALELFGGYGVTEDYPAEKYYRDAKVGKIYEGTSNIQKLTIAKAILSD